MFLFTFNQLLCLLNVPPSKRAITVYDFCSDSSSGDFAANVRATFVTFLVAIYKFSFLYTKTHSIKLGFALDED